MPNSGPLHDTIRYLVQHHVAVTSTLPVFEMGSFPGRPTMQKRVLDALSPDARSAVLANRVRSSDDGRIRQTLWDRCVALAGGVQEGRGI